MPNVADVITQAFEAFGTERVFCVPGESYLALLDSLGDSGIDVITCRHEGTATMMAEATGKLTNQPGICLVTRGPGASNAVHGVHVAQQDSTPLILLIGTVKRAHRGREAWQEIDFSTLFAPLAKAVIDLDDPNRCAEVLNRAYRTATSGRMGPVIITIPEDVFTEPSETPFPDGFDPRPQMIAPTEREVQRLTALLMNAERPMAVIGGSGWTEDSIAQFQSFAERHHLPVGVSFRRQMLFDHTHRCYAGDVGLGINPKLAERIATADLLLLIGTRFGEVASSGYTLAGIPEPQQLLVHVHSDAQELGRLYDADLAINATPACFAKAIEKLTPFAEPTWAAETETAHQDYLDWSKGANEQTASFSPTTMIQELREQLPAQAVLCNGAGNYAIWLHRFFRFQGHGTQLAPTSGSMGYGLPAAIAAKLQQPERQVIALAGDGCFMMSSSELATIATHQLPIVIVVMDNGMYGTIRMHQERSFPNRPVATDLTNPDFVAFSESFGIKGFLVRDNAAFSSALAQALKSNAPALLHVKLDANLIAPEKTL